jgi:hypothetical protein
MPPPADAPGERRFESDPEEGLSAVIPKLLLVPVFVGLVLAVAATTLASGSPAPQRSTHSATISPKPKPVRHVNPVLVRRLRHTVWFWQNVMGTHRRVSVKAPLHTVRALRYWRHQARHVTRLAARPPHKRGWLCIHRFEGGWGDSDDPYWGGLQMDRGFMSTYAPRVLLRRGWADRWTPLQQMWVAERAHRSGRGYWPWPNTARVCGLI